MIARNRLLPGVLAGVVAGLLMVTPASALKVGDKAPPFTLQAPGGKRVQLAELLARGPVVIYTVIQAMNSL